MSYGSGPAHDGAPDAGRVVVVDAERVDRRRDGGEVAVAHQRAVGQPVRAAERVRARPGSAPSRSGSVKSRL